MSRKIGKCEWCQNSEAEVALRSTPSSRNSYSYLSRDTVTYAFNCRKCSRSNMNYMWDSVEISLEQAENEIACRAILGQ